MRRNRERGAKPSMNNNNNNTVRPHSIRPTQDGRREVGAAERFAAYNASSVVVILTIF